MRVSAQGGITIVAGNESQLEIARERIDRLTEWLEVSLGTKITAYAAATSAADIGRIAHGEASPPPAEEERLRNLYAVASYLAAQDGAGSAYAWLTEPNPELAGKPPVELLREGERPESVWLAAAPAF